MRIVIFGLSITSSWGNGHATTFRALTQALAARGHKILFFEKNAEWYASNRDLPEPPYCRVRLFRTWDDVLPQARRALYNCDVAMVGSYFPDGVRALDEMLRSTAPVKTFYDIDTPITVETLRRRSRIVSDESLNRARQDDCSHWSQRLWQINSATPDHWSDRAGFWFGHVRRRTDCAR